MSVQQTVISFIQDKTGEDSVDLMSDIHSQIKSFDFMMLILALEQKFGMQLPIEQMIKENISTVNQLIHWVEQHNES
jgi:acyl carrier protein